MKRLLLSFAVLLAAISVSAENFLLYTSKYGEVLYLNDVDERGQLLFGTRIVSNTYENGQGKILFDDEVTMIGEYAFSYCQNLTSVVIPNSVTRIEYEAFRDCSSLKSVEIGNSVKWIESGVFTNCESLESISGKFASDDNRCLIVNGVLKSFAPAGLTSYVIPNSVTEIGENAFYYCQNLTSVVIPNSVTRIGYEAFSGCFSLTSVVIPNSVTEIGEYAFYYCQNLTSVVIPNSVTEIGMYAFSFCI